MKEYKNPLCIRSAHLNCPLPFALESYWACEADCLHCVGRNLNRIWGNEQRATNPENVRNIIEKALNNPNPISPIACALKAKKAIWIGRKSDPYQPIEKELCVTRKLIQLLIEKKFSFVLCSRYLETALRDEDLFVKAKDIITFLVEITPGGESDWEVFERKRTTPIERRLRIARRWKNLGMNIGVRGEPFIPGYHTTKDFRLMLQRLKSYGLDSYNTYNLHMNAHTLRRLHEVGIDIEKIWECNQDAVWKGIQKKLCRIADDEGIILGCPDFVNVPKGWKSKTNTCCGVNVPNVFTFNTHCWKFCLQNGISKKSAFRKSWEGIGTHQDWKQGKKLMFGKDKNFYTMEDCEL